MILVAKYLFYGIINSSCGVCLGACIFSENTEYNRGEFFKFIMRLNYLSNYGEP